LLSGCGNFAQWNTGRNVQERGVDKDVHGCHR
jgi:hypothetical protein